MEADVTEAIALSIRTGIISTFPEVSQPDPSLLSSIIPSAENTCFPNAYRCTDALTGFFGYTNYYCTYCSRRWTC
jgi:hypothetical protein